MGSALCLYVMFFSLSFQRNGVFEYLQRWQIRHVKDDDIIQFAVLKHTRGKEMGHERDKEQSRSMTKIENKSDLISRHSIGPTDEVMEVM